MEVRDDSVTNRLSIYSGFDGCDLVHNSSLGVVHDLAVGDKCSDLVYLYVKIALFTVGGSLCWQKGVELKTYPNSGQSNITTLIACQAPAVPGVYFLEVTWQGKQQRAKLVSLR